jgi:hypothetical protein
MRIRTTMPAPALALVWRKSSFSGNGGNCVEVAHTPADYVWHKSSFSAGSGDCVEVAYTPTEYAWQKSSYSGNGGDCVEVARPSAGVLVRDSKRPDGPMLAFGDSSWRDFLSILTG